MSDLDPEVDAERYAKLKSIFGAVCDLPAEEWGEAVKRLAGGDSKLASNVHELLMHHDPEAASLELQIGRTPVSLSPMPRGMASGLEPMPSELTTAAPLHRVSFWQEKWNSCKRSVAVLAGSFSLPCVIFIGLAVLGISWFAATEFHDHLIEQRLSMVDHSADSIKYQFLSAAERRLDRTRTIARSPEVLRLIKQLAADRSLEGNLKASSQMVEQLTFFYGSEIDFILRDRNGRLLFAHDSRGSLQAGENSFPIIDTHDIIHVLRGETIMHIPHREWADADSQLASAADDRSDVWILTPVMDPERDVIAVLSIRDVHLQQTFLTMVQELRFGETGEMVPFHKRGIAIAPTRFDETLRHAKILPENAHAALQLRLGDPGVRLDGPEPPDRSIADFPLIDSVAQCIRQRDGTARVGERDYRGIATLGAYRWLHELEFGFIVKIDLAEVVKPVEQLRSRLLFLFVMLLGFMIAMRGAALIAKMRSTSEECERFAPYEVVETIGEGGMGIVYKARHSTLQRMVAIKVLCPKSLIPEAKKRFEREAQLLSQLRSQHIVQVYDFGTTPDDESYIVMEYLVGVRLDAMIAFRGRLNAKQVLASMIQIADAIESVHRLGIIHRDLTPMNVMVVENDGQEKMVLFDFGLAKPLVSSTPLFTTSERVWSGTPIFMPPERIKDPGNADRRGDIYSIGAVGYFMLCGCEPFEGNGPVDVFEKVINGDYRPYHCDDTDPYSVIARELIQKCMEVEPKNRPATAAEVASLATRLPDRHAEASLN